MAFRIFVADGHGVVRRGLRALLEAEEGWTVCGEAANAQQTLDGIKQLMPDLAIMETILTGVNGQNVVHLVGGQKILVFTQFNCDRLIRECLQAGVRGIVWKSDPVQDVVAAVKALQAGKIFFTSQVDRLVVKGYLAHRGGLSSTTLTPRELEVLELVSQGRSSAVAAAVLHISTKTIETHRTNIRKKLGIHSVAGLALYAIRNDVLQIPWSAHNPTATLSADAAIG